MNALLSRMNGGSSSSSTNRIALVVRRFMRWPSTDRVRTMTSRWSSLHSTSLVAQVARFAAVGVANTAVYYGSYLLLRQAMSFLAADILAVVVAMLFAFFAHSV